MVVASQGGAEGREKRTTMMVAEWKEGDKDVLRTNAAHQCSAKRDSADELAARCTRPLSLSPNSKLSASAHLTPAPHQITRNEVQHIASYGGPTVPSRPSKEDKWHS